MILSVSLSRSIFGLQMEWPPSILKHLLLSLFKLIPLDFALTILIAERIERCTVEKDFKEKRRSAFCLKCVFFVFNIWSAWKKWLFDIYIIVSLERTSFLIPSCTVFGYIYWQWISQNLLYLLLLCLLWTANKEFLFCLSLVFINF